MGSGDTNSQPDAPDPVLTAGVVLELGRPHLPAGIAVSTVLAVDESGGEARVYLLDGGWWSKLNGRTGCGPGPA